VIFVANPGLELRDKCGQGNMTVVTMKIGKYGVFFVMCVSLKR
jgi:hypothetical protein